jgi:hypothetical protein
MEKNDMQFQMAQRGMTLVQTASSKSQVEGMMMNDSINSLIESMAAMKQLEVKKYSYLGIANDENTKQQIEEHHKAMADNTIRNMTETLKWIDNKADEMNLPSLSEKKDYSPEAVVKTCTEFDSQMGGLTIKELGFVLEHGGKEAIAEVQAANASKSQSAYDMLQRAAAKQGHSSSTFSRSPRIDQPGS